MRCSGPQSVTVASIVSRRAGPVVHGRHMAGTTALVQRGGSQTGAGQHGRAGRCGRGSRDHGRVRGRPAVAGRLLFTALGRTLVDGALVRWRGRRCRDGLRCGAGRRGGRGSPPGAGSATCSRDAEVTDRGADVARQDALELLAVSPFEHDLAQFEQDARLVLTSPAGGLRHPASVPACYG